MNKKKLIILDLINNKEILREDCYIIRLDKGLIRLKNFKIYDLSKLKKDKIITRKILLYLSNFKTLFKDNDIYKTEISNYRDDKIDIYNRIENISNIKNKNLEKKFDIEIISDRSESFLIFNQFFKKCTFTHLGVKKKINPHLKFFLSRTKFFIKILFINIYLKIFTKKKNITNNLGLSIFPLFIKNNEINLYNKKKLTYLNFLFTDETHISMNISKIIKIIKILRNKKNFYLVERDIEIMDIFKIYFFSLKYLFHINKILKSKIKINNINFGFYINQYFLDSIHNLLKLENYKSSVKKIFSKNFSLNEFHYFLFEYNFGFFLADIIKKNNCEIKLYGYQHGIFDNDNKWLNLISKLNFRENFFPHKIFCKYKISKNIYVKKFKKNVIMNDKINDNFQSKNIFKKIQKSSKNCLFYLGLHDGIDILNELSIKTNFLNKYKNIYIKSHPKKPDIKNFYQNSKFRFIKNLDNINFKDIFVSPTSSLKYLFKEFKLPFKLTKISYRQ